MLSDGDKLYLRVLPSGSKRCRFNYASIEGKRAKLALGPYPEISLVSARELATTRRQHLAAGGDPESRGWKNNRKSGATRSTRSKRWGGNAMLTPQTSTNGVRTTRTRFFNNSLHAFPKLGKHPTGSLNRMDALQCLEAVSLSGYRKASGASTHAPSRQGCWSQARTSWPRA
ncbi:Arm DNA-binding domain-containing protein [Bordetella hinzii]|uniref:Arm DNA-binding domain-containing protein n=1 Tax=Bordetella hinzii TaxID=103855 RepID=UPI0039FC43EF